jgi:hypothetical protein
VAGPNSTKIFGHASNQLATGASAKREHNFFDGITGLAKDRQERKLVDEISWDEWLIAGVAKNWGLTLR